MESVRASLPKFKNPPVIEVVFGVQFKKLEDLKAPHIGLLWQFIDKNTYPSFDLKPELTHRTESFGNQSSDAISAEMFNIPPLPRVLFINKDNHNLVQVQSDRFLQNWRKLGAEGKYPSYNRLFPEFLKSWSQYQTFVKKENLGEILVDQYELTYVNHIPVDVFHKEVSGINEIFPSFNAMPCKFLPTPENVEWRKTFKFPENMGRLHASLKQVVNIQTQKQLYSFDLTARGYASDLEMWFNNAHKWIVTGFDELTSEKIHDVWGKE